MEQDPVRKHPDMLHIVQANMFPWPAMLGNIQPRRLTLIRQPEPEQVRAAREPQEAQLACRLSMSLLPAHSHAPVNKTVLNHLKCDLHAVPVCFTVKDHAAG